MSRHVLLVVIILLTFTSSLASAETFVHAPAGVEMDTPSGWVTILDKKNNVVLRSPDKVISITFILVESNQVKAATKATLKALGAKLEGFKMGKPIKKTTNGMEMSHVQASGKKGDVEVLINVAVINAPSGKALFVQSVGAAAGMKKHMSATNNLLKSIKPSK